MKNEERIKVGQNEAQIAEIQCQLSTVIALINGEFRTALEGINFTLTSENLLDILTGGNKIALEYNQKLSTDIEKISIPGFRKMFENVARDAYSEYEIVRLRMLDKCYSNNRQFISVVDGEAIVSDAAKKQIEEDCSTYITDPKEIELYNLHLKACDALNAMFQGYSSPYWRQMFIFHNNKFEVEPVNYSVLLTNIKK